MKAATALRAVASSTSDCCSNTVILPEADPAAQDRLLHIFRERCMVRALLVTNGVMHLHDAVDGLQQAAEEQGLVDHWGQDLIQVIMADAFREVPK